MKQINCFAGFILASLLLFLPKETTAQPLNPGTYTGTLDGTGLESSAVLPTSTGGIYNVSSANGQLTVIFAPKGTSLFSPISFDCSNYGIASVRGLQSYNVFYSKWIVTCIGQDINGIDGIYAFDCDESGALRVNSLGRLDASQGNLIKQYTVQRGAFYNFYMVTVDERNRVDVAYNCFEPNNQKKTFSVPFPQFVLGADEVAISMVSGITATTSADDLVIDACIKKSDGSYQLAAAYYAAGALTSTLIIAEGFMHKPIYARSGYLGSEKYYVSLPSEISSYSKAGNTWQKDNSCVVGSGDLIAMVPNLFGNITAIYRVLGGTEVRMYDIVGGILKTSFLISDINIGSFLPCFIDGKPVLLIASKRIDGSYVLNGITYNTTTSKFVSTPYAIPGTKPNIGFIKGTDLPSVYTIDTNASGFGMYTVGPSSLTPIRTTNYTSPFSVPEDAFLTVYSNLADILTDSSGNVHKIQGSTIKTIAQNFSTNASNGMLFGSMFGTASAFECFVVCESLTVPVLPLSQNVFQNKPGTPLSSTKTFYSRGEFDVGIYGNWILKIDNNKYYVNAYQPYDIVLDCLRSADLYNRTNEQASLLTNIGRRMTVSCNGQTSSVEFLVLNGVTQTLNWIKSIPAISGSSSIYIEIKDAIIENNMVIGWKDDPSAQKEIRLIPESSLPTSDLFIVGSRRTTKIQPNAITYICNATITLKMDVTDADGNIDVSTMYLEKNGIKVDQNPTNTFLLSGLTGQPGKNTYSIVTKIKDKLNNITTKTYTLVFDYDKYKVNISANPSTWTNGAVEVTASSDFDVDFTYQLQIPPALSFGAEQIGNAVTLTVPMSTIKFTGTDIFGTPLTSTYTAEFIDLTKPNLELIMPTGGYENNGIIWYTTDVLVKVNKDSTIDPYPVSGYDVPSGIDKCMYKVDDGSELQIPLAGASVTVKDDKIHAVTFTVIDKATNSASQTVRFGIDKTGPAIELADPKIAQGWNPGGVTVSANINDAGAGVDSSKCYYKVFKEGTEIIGGTGTSVTMPNEAGTFTVLFHAEDNARNKSEKNFTVKMDATPPSFTLAPEDSSWYNTDVTVRVTNIIETGSGKASCTFSDIVEGATIQAGSGENITVRTEGIHTVAFTMMDNAGNTTTKYVSIRIDKTKPNLNVIPDGTVGWANSSVLLTITTNDDLSGLQPGFYTDGGPMIPLTGPTVTISGDRVHTVQFQVPDKAGNYAEKTVIVSIDGTAPELKLKANPTPSNGWNKAGVTVSAEVTDPASGVASCVYSLNGETNVHSGTSVSFNIEGQYSVLFTATDNAGNTGNKTIIVNIDGTPPEITLQTNPSASSSGWHLTETNVSANVKDTIPGSGVGVVRYSVNGENTVSGTNVLVNNEGKHTVTFTATDKAGNEQSSSIPVHIDLHSPAIMVATNTTAQASGWYPRATTVTINTEDSTSGILYSEYYLDGEKQSGPSFTVNTEGVQSVVCKARDKAGNPEAVVTVPINVDFGAPILSGSVDSFARSGWLGISSLTSYDSGSGLARIEYSIDNSGFSTLADGVAATNIDVSSISEGDHSLSLRAVDKAGNTSEELIKTFIVDRSSPVITGVEIVTIDSGVETIHPESRFVGSNEPTLRIIAQDVYNNGAITKTGSVALYSYYVSKISSETPAEQQFTTTAMETVLTGLTQGANYVYAKVTDAAGNQSPIVVRKVLLDTSGPNTPVVTSVTHPRASASEDAAASTTALFNVRSGGGSASGTSGYVWRLATGTFAQAITQIRNGQLSYAPGTQSTLEVAALPDNNPEEYYYLFVSAIGGNGKKGEEIVYRFRVDTQPPSGLRVTVQPQADDTSWYSQKRGRVRWNKPTDMTGVKAYRYFVTLNDLPLPMNAAEAAAYDLSRWQTTTASNFDFDLSSVLGTAKSGFVSIGVCAEDYAGNRIFAKRKVQLDICAPSIGAADPILASQAGAVDTTRVFSWDAAADAESGLAYAELTIKAIGATTAERIVTLGFKTDGTFPNGYTVEGLANDTAYQASLRVFDIAGNVIEVRSAFVVGSAVLPQDIASDYVENVGGYIARGTRLTTIVGESSYRNILLELPESVELYTIANGPNGETSTRLVNVSFLDNSVVMSSGSLSFGKA